MYNHHYLILALTVLLLILLALLEFGRRIGLRLVKNDPKGAKLGVSQVEGTIFALLGLLIAFTFYGASQRFDQRREMIVNETNAIGTAWLRIDMLPKEYQPQMRDLFRQYAKSRLSTNTVLPDIKASHYYIKSAEDLQGKIWSVAILVNTKESTPTIGVVVIPALNDMFDIATAHNVSLYTHPPLIIYLTLAILLCCSTFFLGYSLAGAKHTNLIHGVIYILVMISLMYVIIDFEFPRAGLIKIEKYDQPLVELIENMK